MAKNVNSLPTELRFTQNITQDKNSVKSKLNFVFVTRVTVGQN